MAKPPATIGFVGDIHCGSHVGLWPVRDLPEDKTKYLGCRYLMQCWQHLVERWPKLDILILMGDLIDGKQRKSDGVGVFDTDLAAQADGAVEVLRPLAEKAGKIIRVWGTPYHESHDGILKIVDCKLGVAKTAQVIDLDLNGKTLNVAHHPASGAAIYAGTVADREVLWAKIAASDKKVPNPRWIVRAHKHNYILQDTEHATIVQMPCWQLPTAHAIKQNYWRFQPTLGGLLMLADGMEDSGYRFVCTKYDLPMPEVTPWQSL